MGCEGAEDLVSPPTREAGASWMWLPGPQLAWTHRWADPQDRLCSLRWAQGTVLLLLLMLPTSICIPGLSLPRARSPRMPDPSSLHL